MTPDQVPDFQELTALTVRGKERGEALRLGLALDVAIAFGAMLQRANTGGLNELSDLELAALYAEKLARLRQLSAS